VNIVVDDRIDSIVNREADLDEKQGNKAVELQLEHA
jgi:hypothetical protein